MTSKAVSELECIVEELLRSDGPVETAALARVAEHIARAFGVRPDEVAILALVEGGKFLAFLIPERFGRIGTIPMTSTTALAVRTARDQRPEAINKFPAVRHATVFEAMPIQEERGDPIQKIMSAPITAENKVVGVVQVSRKGKTSLAAGPDFTPKDLSELVAMGRLLGPCVQRCRITS